MIIVGVDPGYSKLGLAVIEEKIKGSGRLIFSECFITPSKLSFPDRLLALGEHFVWLVENFKPNYLAIEKVFFTTNQKTALLVSEVKGLLLYLAKKNNLIINEYTPLEVKQTITGYGKATKEQVKMMVSKLISLPKIKTEDDEIDAIAIALTGLAFRKNSLV